MKFLSLILLVVALVGCETAPKLTATQIVHVPIITKCTPTLNVTEIKEYPTAKIKKDMSLFEKFQLVLAERALLKGQNIELKAALKECTK